MSKSEPFEENPFLTAPLRKTIGVLGGTGPEGRGIAARFASVGFPIVIGSREKRKARDAATRILSILPEGNVLGTDNADMIRRCDIVFLTVPFSVQQEMLQTVAGLLSGKVVVCTSVPIRFKNTGIELLPVNEGGAALQAKADLPHVAVVGAFQNIGAADLWKIGQPLNADVIVASDCESAKREVMDLCSLVPGLGAVDGGDLGSTPYVEALTVLLLRINRNYQGKHATVKITGIVS